MPELKPECELPSLLPHLDWRDTGLPRVSSLTGLLLDFRLRLTGEDGQVAPLLAADVLRPLDDFDDFWRVLNCNHPPST